MAPRGRRSAARRSVFLGTGKDLRDCRQRFARSDSGHGYAEKEEENQNAVGLHNFELLAENRWVEENQIDLPLSFQKIRGRRYRPKANSKRHETKQDRQAVHKSGS